MISDSKIYVVETISTFRHTYYIRAKEEIHAQDEVVCNISNPEFIEGSQKHIDESISNTIELTEEEFIKLFDKENEYLRSWSKDQKLDMINVINYKE